MENEKTNSCSLWLQFKNGNQNAFAELYQLHIDLLISYGFKLCKDETILKDAIQDLFLELWKSRNNLAEPTSVKFYLIKCLRYKILRAEKLRHSKNMLTESFYKEPEFGRNLEATAEDRIIDKEIIDTKTKLLNKAIKGLSKRQQEAIQLRFYQGFTNDQIAEIMGMNYQSVSNLIYHSLERIKKNLQTPVLSRVLTNVMHLFF